MHDAAQVKAGDVLAGKYRVERVLGQGGMGVVVAAFHLQLEQRVALKFLLPEALRQPEMLARFSREARAAARIRSEHIARVIDVGTLETGVPYIVMEYLEGSDLSGHLTKVGPLPIAQAAALALEACDALAEAHAVGIVHRDLKPANLFLARAPDQTTCLKILDFGISKIISPDEADFDMTRTGAVVGSPYYMSPEQMRSSRSVDARTDIWSLGVILYELVSGHVPFEAPTLPQLCGMILTDPPPALTQWRPDVPPPFQALVARCLEKDPALRFQSVGEFAIALARFAPEGAARSLERIVRLSGGKSKAAGETPSRAPDRSPDVARAGERPMRTDWGRTSTRGGRSRGLWGVLAGFALMAGLASWVLLRGARHSPHATDAVGAASDGLPSTEGPGAPAPSRDPRPVPLADEPALEKPMRTEPSGAGSARSSPIATSSAMGLTGPRHAPTAPKRSSSSPTTGMTGQAPPPSNAAPSPLDGRL
ncbi:MAG TPA: protein kinase [Polyangiaceae bacterium]|jgi:serine/threonine-protein kinase|nr:protein kinase [Polyangiaceae bacterium]